MVKIPKVGDCVRMLAPTTSDNEGEVETTTPIGARFLIEGRRLLAGQQGLQFQLASAEYGVFIFVDETDLVDDCYPFEIVPA